MLLLKMLLLLLYRPLWGLTWTRVVVGSNCTVWHFWGTIAPFIGYYGVALETRSILDTQNNPTVQFDTTPTQSHRNLKTAKSPSSHYPQCTLFTPQHENLLKNCLQFIMRWLLYPGKNWKQWLRKILGEKQTVLYGHSENGDVKFKWSVALVSK